jgi:hypothetical protein
MILLTVNVRAYCPVRNSDSKRNTATHGVLFRCSALVFGVAEVLTDQNAQEVDDAKRFFFVDVPAS